MVQLYLFNHDPSYLRAVPSDGVLANLLRLGHDLDTAVLVVLQDVAVHLQGVFQQVVAGAQKKKQEGFSQLSRGTVQGEAVLHYDKFD